MQELTCRMMAWISLMISLSLFSFTTLTSRSVISTAVSSVRLGLNRIIEACIPFLDDLAVSDDVEVPALEHLAGGLAHDDQHNPLQLPTLQPLCSPQQIQVSKNNGCSRR